jgi:hypothetical protein
MVRPRIYSVASAVEYTVNQHSLSRTTKPWSDDMEQEQGGKGGGGPSNALCHGAVIVALAVQMVAELAPHRRRRLRAAAGVGRVGESEGERGGVEILAEQLLHLGC